MKLLEIENLEVTYKNGYTALEGISISAPHPSFLTIIGPNGAGKSTLVKVLVGLVKKTKGKVIFMGHDVDRDIGKIRKKIGYVPQREYISTTVPMRVKDVILMLRLMRKGYLSLPSKKDVQKAKEALEYVGLSELWNAPFRSLSGGQQQRVMLARALAVDPEVLVLDEPFSATDIATEKKLIQLLYELRWIKKKSIILVTHDISTPYGCSDYMLLLRRKMIAFGSPLDVITEENLKQLYGVPVRIEKRERICYLSERDRHV